MEYIKRRPLDLPAGSTVAAVTQVDPKVISMQT